MAYLKDYQSASENSNKFDLDKIPNWLLKTGEAEHFAMPQPDIYGNQADLYRKLSWVTSACENVAKVAAPVPFDVKRKVGEREKDIPNHEFELLLEKPNELDSRSELLKATIIMYLLNGNAYWWLNRPNEITPPEEIWYIPPHMIIPNPDGKLYLKNYLYYPGTGEEIEFEPWEIVHFRRFNPFSRFIGLSAIESIALIAFGDLGMASWNSRLFKENNGRLPGMITFEQFVADDAWDIIKRDMDDAARKRQFMMLRGVGAGGVNWYQNAVSQREMEFLDGRKFNRDEIWNVIAPGLVSYLSESSTEANSRTGESAFERLSIFPILDDMSQGITNKILSSYPGKRLVGKFRDVRTIDQSMELEKQKQYENSHTVGEIRAEFYNHEPFGDERDEMSVQQFLALSGKPDELIKKELSPTKGKTPPDKATPEENVEKVSGKFNDEILKELNRFQRKALKSIGKDVVFESDFIPDSQLNFLHEQLDRCFDEKSIRVLFVQAKEEAFKSKKSEGSDPKDLATSINNLAAVLEK